MFQKTLYTKTAKVLDLLAEEGFLSSFYLAGGTGLALQLGHRKSIDLEFFSSAYPGNRFLLKHLVKFNPELKQETEGSLDMFINEVKVSFLEYDYPLLVETKEFNSVEVADLLDIACMKITAISPRGSKKDFVDLYFLLQKYSLVELLSAFEKKYAGIDYSKAHILKSLAYINDAEADPDPDYLKDISWEEVKCYIEKVSSAHVQRIL